MLTGLNVPTHSVLATALWGNIGLFSAFSDGCSERLRNEWMWRVVNPGVLVQTPCWVPLCCPAFPSSFHYMGSRLTSHWAVCVCVSLCNPTDCSPSDSSVHGILQTRKLSYLCKFLETRIQFDWRYWRYTCWITELNHVSSLHTALQQSIWGGRLSTLAHSTSGGPAILPWPDEEQQILKSGHHTANQGNSNE